MKNLKLTTVMNIALQAANELRNIYYNQHNLEIDLKADQTPVTNADLLANKIIVSQLKQYFPDIPIISEEEPDISFGQRRLWPRYWLIDPLDGTSQFINRTGEFSINIALIEHNEPILGVVSVPASNLVYYALKGAKAYKQYIGHKPQEIQVKALSANKPLIVIAGHTLNVSQRLLDSLTKLKINYQLIQHGSSLKICKIAEGLAHLYPRLEKNCEWDTAAAHCILIAAGGQMINLATMQELKYNTKESLISEEFVACAPSLEYIVNSLSTKEYTKSIT
jgi:3'(2'), 5'-bisphosphate nucleotidase